MLSWFGSFTVIIPIFGSFSPPALPYTESEWQQVSSGHQDSSQYSSRSWQCTSLDGFDFPTDFQFLQPFLQTLGSRTKRINYYWY